MDQSGLSNTEISSNNSYNHLLIKRTLQFLVPLSLASFLLSCTSSTFAYLLTHNFHCFSTLLFPILTHAFERKYMFLICNGIVAFLVKTLSFNKDNSSLSVSDIIDNDEFCGESVSAESSPDLNVALADDEEEEEKHGKTQIKATFAGEKEEEQEYFQVGSEEAALAVVELGEKPNVSSAAENDAGEEEEEQEYFQAGPEEAAVAVVELGEKPNVSSAAENEGRQTGEENGGRQTGDFIIQSDELEMMCEVEDDEEEYMEEGGGELAEQVMDVNMNTEELNKKCEEFIRKMKEDIRIQARQQLVEV